MVLTVSRLVSMIRAMRISSGIEAAIQKLPVLMLCHSQPEYSSRGY